MFNKNEGFMETLSLNIFLQAADDIELSRYKVMAAIKNSSETLHKNMLYPDLAELIKLYSILNDIVTRRTLLHDSLPSKLVGFDLENKKAIYEKEELSESKTKLVFDFINWAMPKIKEIIDEGKAIFDFIENNLIIIGIGILPIYKKEGYFIIPDNQEDTMLVYRYEMTLFPAQGETFHTLKTNLVEAINSNDVSLVKPEEIKLEMIKRYPELPNPAAYKFYIDIDFPFAETILPIAKRKLIRELAA